MTSALRLIDTSAGSATGAQSLHSETQRLFFSGVHEEFIDLVSRAAIAASIVTSRALLRPVADVHLAANHLPRDPVLLSAQAFALADVPVDRDHASSFVDFRVALGMAKQATLDVETVTLRSLSTDAGWFEASLCWRKVAADALDVSNAISSIGQRLDIPFDEPAMRVDDLLRRIRDGEAPCVMRDGNIALPSLDERRVDQRRRVDLPAWWHVAEIRKPVVLVDVSKTGFGVRGCAGLQAGERLAIEIPGGRLLCGIAMWAQGDAVGVRMFEPLTDSDALMSG